MKVDEQALVELRATLEAATARCLPVSMASHRDDVVQLAMLKAADALRAGRPVTKRWLARVAYTTMIDELRRNRIGREDPSSDGELEVASPQASPEEQIRDAELGGALASCLEQLAPRSRRSITLFLAGHQAREVARVVAVTTKAVQHLISRARLALRQCLSKKGFAPGGSCG